MGANNARPNINEAEYEADFKATSQHCQNGPKQDRGCQDVCCLVTFIILTLVFVASGLYFISTINANGFQKFNNSFSKNTATKNTLAIPRHESVPKNLINVKNIKHAQQEIHDQTGPVSGFSTNSSSFPSLSSAIPYILFMCVLSLILSVVLVIAISQIPKVVVYGTIAVTFIMIAAGIVIGLVIGELSLVLICGIFGLIWGLIIILLFCCWRQQFQAAIVLLKVTGDFLKYKPTIFLAPIFPMVLSFFFFVFWLISFAAIQFNRPSQSLNSNQKSHEFNAYDAFSGIWIFFSIFYSYFFYYVMVFLIATATAMWYFNKDENYLIEGVKTIWKSHIGSLTFASMIVTIVSMLKSAANNQNNQEQNGCAIVCLCIVRCCLEFIEDLIETLNHNAIIVMSVQGQGFIDSAKSAIYLIFNYFGIFISVEMVESLLYICAFFITVVTPTAFGLLLLKLTYNQDANDEGTYLLMGALTIFFICLAISLLTITILSQTLSCVFIFYCLNQQFKKLNYGSVNRVSQEIQDMFSQIDQQSNGQFASLNNNVQQGQNYNQNNGYSQPGPAQNSNQNNPGVYYNPAAYYSQPPSRQSQGYGSNSLNVHNNPNNYRNNNNNNKPNLH